MAKKKKKNKKALKILIAVLVVLLLADIGVVGITWFRDTHIIVDRVPYPIHARELNLLEKEITFEHYDAVHSQLPNCDIIWNVPFQNGRYPSNSTELAVQDPSSRDLEILQTYFPKLRKIDASACRDYDAVEAMQALLPKADIRYTVSLGGVEAAPTETALELKNGDYTYSALYENLAHLPMMKSLLLHTPELTEDELAALQERYPELELRCTVSLMGQELQPDTHQLDLSTLQSADVDEVSRKLAMLPELEQVELEGAELSMAEAARLIAAAPKATFHYSFDFYGQTLSTDMETVHIKNVKIGDEGEETVRQALSLMNSCSRFVLENCRISNEVMASIREDFRGQTKVVWRVYFGGGSALTDCDVIRSVYDLVDDNCHDLMYCEDVRYMDIGHDVYLDAVPFIAYMPNLEYVIVSGSPIKSLEPFANCKKLKVLELAYCGYIEDLTPLAGCESLEKLNLSYTLATDLSPLDDLNLDTLIWKCEFGAKVSEEEQARFREVHPDCFAQFDKDSYPYGLGWRVTAEKEATAWYAEIGRAFRYPDPPNNTGWFA